MDHKKAIIHIAVAVLLIFAAVSCSGKRKVSEPVFVEPNGTFTVLPQTATPSVTPSLTQMPSPTVTPTMTFVPAHTITWSNSGGDQFALYIPQAHQGAAVPVVMFLHGYTQNPITSPPWIINSLNQSEPCAVFMPYRPASEGASAWGGTYDSYLRASMVSALAELDSVIADNGFDSGRQYLFGISMGAEGVLKLLAQYPDRFVSAVSVAGYTVMTGAGPMAVEMAKTPLWLLWGETDYDLVSEDRNIYSLISAQPGADVIGTEYPGQDHMGSIYASESEPGLCAWLLSKRR